MDAAALAGEEVLADAVVHDDMHNGGADDKDDGGAHDRDDGGDYSLNAQDGVAEGDAVEVEGEGEHLRERVALADGVAVGPVRVKSLVSGHRL